MSSGSFTNNGGDLVWENDANWTGVTYPNGSSDTATFDGSYTGTGTITTALSSIDVNSLRFLGGTPALIVDFNTAYLTIHGNWDAFASSPTVHSGTGTIEIKGNFDFSNGMTVVWETGSTCKLTGSSSAFALRTSVSDFYNLTILTDAATDIITFENDGSTTLNVTNAFLVTKGEFDCVDNDEGDLGFLNVNGNFIIGAEGTFTCSSDTTLEINLKGNFTIISGGTFTKVSSTITFSGTANQEIDTDGNEINGFDVDKSAGILEFQANVISAGFHLIDGTVDLDDGATGYNLICSSCDVESGTVLNIDFSGTQFIRCTGGEFYSHTSPAINWHADSHLEFTGTSQDYRCVSSSDAPPLTIIDGSAVDSILSGSDIGAIDTRNGGTFTFSEHTWIGQNVPNGTKILRLENPTDLLGSASLYVTNNATGLTMDGFTNTSLNIRIQNNGGDLSLGGDISVQDVQMAVGGTLKCVTYAITTIDNAEIGRSTDDDGGHIYWGTGTHYINGDLILATSGVTTNLTTFMESATIHLRGTHDVIGPNNPAYIDQGTSNIIFDGTGTQIIDLDGNFFYDLTFANTAGLIDVEGTGGCTGTLFGVASSGTVNVEFASSNSQTWGNIDMSGLTGGAGISLISKTFGAQWNLTLTSNQTVTNVLFQDCNLTNFQIDATDPSNADGGNNTPNIIFTLSESFFGDHAIMRGVCRGVGVGIG